MRSIGIIIIITIIIIICIIPIFATDTIESLKAMCDYVIICLLAKLEKIPYKRIIIQFSELTLTSPWKTVPHAYTVIIKVKISVSNSSYDLCYKIMLEVLFVLCHLQFHSHANNKLPEEEQGLSSLCDQTPLQNLQLATMPIKCINVPAIIKHAVS